MRLYDLGLAVVALAFLGLCGGKSGSSSSTAPPARNAGDIVGALKSAGLPITDSKVYTADDDPDKLLGRPNQYTSKSNFHDSRIKVLGLLGFDVQAGGSVEVFDSADKATMRKNYLESIGKLTPLLLEYDYQQGDVVLRLSRSLTPDQAQAYLTSLQTVVK